MQLGGEEEKEKAGEDLSDDKEEEEEGEGVGKGGGGAAGGDQAQGPNQKKNATWNQIENISKKILNENLPKTKATMASLPRRLSVHGLNSWEPRRLEMQCLSNEKYNYLSKYKCLQDEITNIFPMNI